MDTVSKNTYTDLKSNKNYPSLSDLPGKIVPTTEAKGPRVVLIYTAFFGSNPWKGLENSQSWTHFKGKPCPVQNCVVSYKTEEFSSSNVVIFHGRDMPHVNTLRKLHNKDLLIKPGSILSSKALPTALMPGNMVDYLTGQ